MNNDIEKELKELQIQYDKVLKERNELEKENKLLKKDLEILEIIKKKMSIGTDYYDSDDGCEKIEYILYNDEVLNIDTEEEFNIIKEWLENDQRIL